MDSRGHVYTSIASDEIKRQRLHNASSLQGVHVGCKKHTMYGVLGSKVDKPSEFLIKTLNAAEYIESDIQNIEAPRIDNPII